MIKNNSGLTLIEVILSVTLLGLIGTALATLGITALRTADAARRRSVAAEYSKEALEAVRSIRDQQGWQTFDDNLGDFCLENATGRFNLRSDGDSRCRTLAGYSQKITIAETTPTSPNRRKVLVTTSYDERGVLMEVLLDSLLTNWR